MVTSKSIFKFSERIGIHFCVSKRVVVLEPNKLENLISAVQECGKTRSDRDLRLGTFLILLESPHTQDAMLPFDFLVCYA